MNNNNNNRRLTKAQKRRARAAMAAGLMTAPAPNRYKSSQKQQQQVYFDPALSRKPGRKARKQASVAAAYATGQSGKGAQVQASLDKCHIRHREFIGNVTGTTAFTIADTFAVNPGLAASFPWLAGIAQNWETYRFNRLRMCYYTRTGSNVPGSVIMAHDPDASDAAPVTEQIMTTYESTEEDAPWKDICLEVRSVTMQDIGPRKFIRTGPLAANQDVKLYDSGNLFVATVDGTAVSWGKLWVEYDIDLFTPQLPPGGDLPFGGEVNGNGVFSAANPLGSTATVNGNSAGISVNTTSVVTLNQLGTYEVTAWLTGTVVTAFPDPTVVGGTLVSQQAFLVNGAGTIAANVCSVTVTSLPCTLSYTATATTVTAATLYIGQAPAASLP